jgi:F0F1-type ATP synthase assembly protein I
VSLKTFHILFISISVLLCAGCALWAFAYGVEPVFGVASILVGLALAIYGVLFLRKSKGIIT